MTESLPLSCYSRRECWLCGDRASPPMSMAIFWWRKRHWRTAEKSKYHILIWYQLTKQNKRLGITEFNGTFKPQQYLLWHWCLASVMATTGECLWYQNSTLGAECLRWLMSAEFKPSEQLQLYSVLDHSKEISNNCALKRRLVWQALTWKIGQTVVVTITDTAWPDGSVRRHCETQGVRLCHAFRWRLAAETIAPSSGIRQAPPTFAKKDSIN